MKYYKFFILTLLSMVQICRITGVPLESEHVSDPGQGEAVKSPSEKETEKEGGEPKSETTVTEATGSNSKGLDSKQESIPEKKEDKEEEKKIEKVKKIVALELVCDALLNASGVFNHTTDEPPKENEHGDNKEGASNNTNDDKEPIKKESDDGTNHGPKTNSEPKETPEPQKKEESKEENKEEKIGVPKTDDSQATKTKE